MPSWTPLSTNPPEPAAGSALCKPGRLIFVPDHIQSQKDWQILLQNAYGGRKGSLGLITDPQLLAIHGKRELRKLRSTSPWIMASPGMITLEEAKEKIRRWHVEVARLVFPELRSVGEPEDGVEGVLRPARSRTLVCNQRRFSTPVPRSSFPTAAPEPTKTTPILPNKEKPTPKPLPKASSTHTRPPPVLPRPTTPAPQPQTRNPLRRLVNHIRENRRYWKEYDITVAARRKEQKYNEEAQFLKMVDKKTSYGGRYYFNYEHGYSVNARRRWIDRVPGEPDRDGGYGGRDSITGRWGWVGMGKDGAGEGLEMPD
ncbi:hypothetical protein BJ508DRAFT_330091 [Ascobolus immersus RN42]|uniref:Uncharacterized protein n=1 Tax=Ascobolus immersus RN42 TaxID=1160509 RepID=A0A3N4I726_ASCIM|nr:hypothetical protein BJ508DRAFT_330091 [Ascobolus immersus RN42]